ncbi:DNA-processing protein DprA [Scatolibacter rhodanostii]|uniref:DNA-processing protein DprA n=1 Tax=Scatolibacter rhodanostii TaxID=2014781 RepID=UPI000C07CFBD|nr:DNA-processing protein DprA [Scatolibacter rhodanostii]
MEEFHNGKTPLWNSMKFISEKEARMLSVFSLEQAEILLEMCEKLKHKVITPEDEKYPDALRNIFDPPAVLYYRGELPNVDTSPTISVVGTRKASQKSLDAATTIGYQLAISGAMVVSGGALGVDSAAHRGAMRGMGKTICVLPCGLTNGYLVENYALREKIVDNGALVTEYPIDTGVTKGTFQVRNRIISGLSCATLIIQAEQKSGAMITARHAKEQDRDVFVYIGDAGSKEFAGCEALVRDGAKSIVSGDEILEDYQNRFSPVIVNNPKKKKVVPQVIQIEMPMAAAVMADVEDKRQIFKGAELTDKDRILSVLSAEPQHFSVIEKETNLSSSAVLAALTELELSAQIRSFSGRRYALK